MAHLYELSNDFNQLLHLIEDMAEGNTETYIPEEALWDTIEGIEGELKDKAISVACIIKDLNADINAFKEEEKKLAERRKSMESKVEWLKDYLTHQLNESGVTMIKDRPEAQITFRTSKAVQVANEEELIEWAKDNGREDLLSIKYSVSKTTIKQSLDTGAEIPGCSIVENKSIQIK